MNAAARTDGNLLTDMVRSRAGRLLTTELHRRWPDDTDRLATMTRYALLPAGKLIRPILTVYSADATGGWSEAIVAAALSVEYLHAATLAHDDIIDGDIVRRGRPSMPAAFGSTDALLCGDHLIFAAFQALAGWRTGPGGPESVVAAVEALAVAGADLCRGQLMETEPCGDLNTSVTDYLELVRLKTGALFRAACQIGALLSGAHASHVDGLAQYGERLGIAFQIRDDLLAYTVSEEIAGKPATSDLVNGRPTLPVLLAYQHGSAVDRDWLAGALRRGVDHDGALAAFHRVLDQTGALDRSRECLAEQAQLAIAGLSTLDLSDSVATLSAVARWMSTGGH
jgi:geranylgeranyl diphosphate synthase type I